MKEYKNIKEIKSEDGWTLICKKCGNTLFKPDSTCAICGDGPFYYSESAVKLRKNYRGPY